MTTVPLTNDLLIQTMRILAAADSAICAADIALRLGLEGCRESQRRQVRAIIKQLRDEGEWIVATLQGGYWLTEDRDLWRHYLTGRTIEGKCLIGESHARRRMATDGREQGLLFTGFTK